MRLSVAMAAAAFAKSVADAGAMVDTSFVEFVDLS